MNETETVMDLVRAEVTSMLARLREICDNDIPDASKEARRAMSLARRELRSFLVITDTPPRRPT